MAVELGNATLFALAILVINGGLQWIRELKKGNNNGKHLKEIKESIGKVDTKVGKTNVELAKISTAVNSQKTQCATTVKRFDEAISKQNQQIINLAGRKR